ncbi:MAG: hypothetical protein RSC51_05090, partial [Oscillospiraceae bacterium]
MSQSFVARGRCYFCGGRKPLNLTLTLSCHSERSEESFPALELIPINRNMVAHIRQCAHWLAQNTISLLRKEKRFFGIPKRKKPKGWQVPPLETPEVSEGEAQQLSGKYSNPKSPPLT